MFEILKCQMEAVILTNTWSSARTVISATHISDRQLETSLLLSIIFFFVLMKPLKQWVSNFRQTAFFFVNRAIMWCVAAAV